MFRAFFRLVTGSLLGGLTACLLGVLEHWLAVRRGIDVGAMRAAGMAWPFGLLLGGAGAMAGLLLDQLPLQSIKDLWGPRTETPLRAAMRGAAPAFCLVFATVVATRLRDRAASGMALRELSILTSLEACIFVAFVWLLTHWPTKAQGGHPLRTVVGVAWAATAAVFIALIARGNTDGHGFFGIWGVLAREELDLRPLGYAVVPALIAYVASAEARPSARFMVPVLLSLVLGAFALQRAAGIGVDEASRIEEGAPYSRIAMHVLRKPFDKDRDGAASRFGGGDCNDHAPDINPMALEVPGNGIDEDCSGADLIAAAPASKTVAAAQPQYSSAKNLIFITVDTLRHDLQWTGYGKPNAPRLTEFAQKSVWFERAYAMASYTGKSLGPLMAGKYPSETPRDGGHFTSYPAVNKMVAERLKEAGLKTFGASALKYVSPGSGLTQGFDTWDLSAVPQGSMDHDGSITSDKLTDVALKQLADPSLTSARFFAWYHYMDPHRDYVAHKGAPDFAAGEKGPTKLSRAAYDGEVWFTDSQVGRLIDGIEKQPWGKDTVVIVTADHGEAFNDHGMSYHGFELWESLVRVPLLVHAPGVTAHVVKQRRSHIDLAPTMMSLLGVEAELASFSGQSLLPDLLGERGAQEEPRDTYVDMPIGPYNETRRALLSGQGAGTKLLSRGGGYELYDLENDPAEATNLAKDKQRLKPFVERFQLFRAGLHEIDVKPKGLD